MFGLAPMSVLGWLLGNLGVCDNDGGHVRLFLGGGWRGGLGAVWGGQTDNLRCVRLSAGLTCVLRRRSECGVE